MARLELNKEAQTSGESQTPPRQVSWRSHMARYVVVVDGQAKSSYAKQDDAEVEAKKISSKFPILQVRVKDWERDSVTTLGPTSAPPEPAETEVEDA